LISNVTDQKEEIYLYPAALIVPEKPSIVHTILGSCVSVCLFDRVKSFGGINHYMLPLWNGNGLASPKYGNIAIEKLYESMLRKGAEHKNLIAKIFGGGEVLQTLNSHFNVGQRNIVLAHEILKKLNINIVAESTGGQLGRKIVFNSGTGEINQRYVRSTRK
jgi:chemotaxis protein CheD